MHALLAVRPRERVDEVKDLVRRGEGGHRGVGRAVVEEDVERDAVPVIVSGGEGAEAAAKRGRPVVGEELDEEGEAAGIGAGAGARAGGVEERGGRMRGAVEEEEDKEERDRDEDEEAEWEGAAARRRHCGGVG